MATYKASQLPSFADVNEAVWVLHDDECNIQLKRGRLSGEWIKWNDDDDWTGTPMKSEDVVSVVKNSQIVLPSGKGLLTVAELIKQGKIKLAEWV